VSHHHDWVTAIREGRQASSNFDYGGPLTELALLGVVALRLPGQRLQWDGDGMRFADNEQANQLLTWPTREQW
jgi:hypothetical protein